MAKKAIPARLRELARLRAEGCCEYCRSQERYATHLFSIDHAWPESKGGPSDDLNNLVLACQGCNNYKYNHTHAQDPETKQVVSLFNPRRESWEAHFQWNENFTVIIGISPVGRATVNLLRLNRITLIHQRVVYRAYGVHPPS